jgi:hypothetical protein
MENEGITVEIGFDKIKIALEKAAGEMFKSSYSNPVSDLLKKCIEDKQGEVKKIVDEIIVSSINSPDFKTKMADVIIQRMVEAALKK